MHLGYRYLSPKQNYLYGAYVAFDRNRSARGNYFSQVTLGAEGWFKQIYLGGNVYIPAGNNAKCITPVTSVIDYQLEGDKIAATYDGLYEKALSGADITVGYEMMPGLVGKISGYYFGSKNVDTIYGPRVTLAYDLLPKTGERVLSIFDKVGFEFGVQNDKRHNTTVHVGVNFRVGLSKDSNTHLQGVVRHMVDLVQRDVDIVSTDAAVRSTIAMPNVVNDQKIVMIGKTLNSEDMQKLVQDYVQNGGHGTVAEGIAKTTLGTTPIKVDGDNSTG